MAYVYSVTKVGSTISVKFTFTSDILWKWIRITGFIDRTGGGHSQVDWYQTSECGMVNNVGVSTCSVTKSITDVSGTEKYTIGVYPQMSGTAAGRQNEEIGCGFAGSLGPAGGIHCAANEIRYF